MGLIISFPESFSGDVGIDLGGGEGGVAEEGLHAAQVGPGIKEMSGKGMAQFVRGDVEGNIGVSEVLLE